MKRGNRHYNNQKVLIPLAISLIFLSACGNTKELESEIARLQGEKATLTQKVQQVEKDNINLKAELDDLKQTDQYLYSKAKSQYDWYKDNNSESALKSARTLLDKLMTRFPNSSFKEQASSLLKTVESKIAATEKINNTNSKINSAISSNEFDKAWSALRSIKQDIPEAEYRRVAKIIDDKQNQPVNISVTDLLAERRKYARKKVLVQGYMFTNYADMERFYISEHKMEFNPHINVDYEDLSVQEKKKIMPLSPGGNNKPFVTVIGVFDGDDKIKAIEVRL